MARQIACTCGRRPSTTLRQSPPLCISSRALARSQSRKEASLAGDGNSVCVICVGSTRRWACGRRPRRERATMGPRWPDSLSAIAASTIVSPVPRIRIVESGAAFHELRVLPWADEWRIERFGGFVSAAQNRHIENSGLTPGKAKRDGAVALAEARNGLAKPAQRAARRSQRDDLRSGCQGSVHRPSEEQSKSDPRPYGRSLAANSRNDRGRRGKRSCSTPGRSVDDSRFRSRKRARGRSARGVRSESDERASPAAF